MSDVEQTDGPKRLYVAPPVNAYCKMCGADRTFADTLCPVPNCELRERFSPPTETTPYE